MEKVTFINSQGESITFDGPPFYLQSITGLGDVTADIQRVKSAYHDGSTQIDAILDDRELEINFVIASNYDESYGDVSERRRLAARILNPKLGMGTLKYENERVTRYIDCIADSVPIYPDKNKRSKRIQVASVTLIAPSVFWLGETVNEPSVFIPLFKWPIDSDKKYLMGMQQNERTIENDGDGDSPIYCEIHGPALNPRITNKTTGKKISLTVELKRGETIIIDTHTDKIGVTFFNSKGQGFNAMQYLDLDSSLASFLLQPGRNNIVFHADSGLHKKSFILKWNKRYSAV